MFYYSAYFKPKIGALKGAGTLTPTQKSHVVSDVLLCKNIRSRIVILNDISSGLGGWDGSSSTYELNQSLGLKQVLVINAYPTGIVQPYIDASTYAAYKTAIANVFDTYPDVDFAIGDNEQQTLIYHSGVMSNYINYQLKGLYEVAHPRGIKVADGGILNGFALHIRVYQDVVNRYGQTAADNYAIGINMTNHQIRYAKGIDSDTGFDSSCADLDLILTQGKNYVDFFNHHFYEEPADESITSITTNAFRYHKEYIESFGRLVITNECGQRNNSQPGLVTNMMNEFKRLHVPIIQWWDGTGDSGARPLTSDDTFGDIFDNGIAFRNKVTANT